MSRILPVLAVLLWLTPFVGAAPVINEVQSTNISLPDQYGQLMDWVEIHNPTGAPINLQGYYLSDSTSNRLKFQFGDVTISAGGYLIVWCGQANEFTTTGPYPAGQVRATNFNISSGGEPIVLTAPDSVTTVDEFTAQVIGSGRTLGRGTGANFNTLFFYDTPTFGVANTTTGTPTLTPEPPVFSMPAGVYTNDDITVAISLPTNVTSGTIRYTLDGSEPTTNSPVYSGPLTLNASTTTNTNSYIPTNLDRNPGPPLYEGWRPPVSQPFRINVLRARVFAAGSGAGRVQTASYLQHTSGTNRYSVPVISVATDPANMFSNDRGIYVPGWFNNMFQEGSAWERPGNIEFFETGGSLAFAGTIGLRLHGNTTRSRPRKSLRIYARNPYGESVFRHQIFPQKDIERFDTFLLRNGGNDWGNSLFRDALVTTLAEPTGLDIQSSRPAAVFISGEYWGIHNLRDRIDEGYFFHHYGLGTTNFSQIEVIPTADNSTVVEDNGSAMGVVDFQALLDRAASTGFVSETNYAHLASRIDIDNYIDYNAFEIWSGNTDWPGNNYRLWRSVNADTSPGANPRHDGRWRWILFDTDFGLGSDFSYVPGHNSDVTSMAQFNSLAHATSTGGEFFSNKELATRLLRKALENSTFRQKFINRFADLLNTTLSAGSATTKLDEFVALYGPEIPEHVARWRQPYNWSNDVARIRTYMQARPAAVRGHIAGKFGLAGTAALTVDIADTNQGSVTVNSVSINSSTPGIGTNVYPWTGTYFRGVPITVTAVPKPGYRFSSWSDSESTNTNALNFVASDSTASYGNWNQGSTGGFGFQPWSLAETGSANDGFFVGGSSRAIHALSPDGRSFGIFAHGGGSASATRIFSGGVLGTNHTFSAIVSPGSFSGQKGIALGAAGVNRVSFYSGTGSGQSRYYFRNQGSTSIITNTFSADTNSTFNFSVTHLGSNIHRVTIVRGATAFVTNVTLSGALDRAVFYNTNSGGSDDVHNLYFNNLAIARPGTGSSTNVVDPLVASVAVNLTGPRTLTANFEPEPATALAIAPSTWTIGLSNAPILVRAVNTLGDTDVNFTGTVTLTITGSGGLLGTYTAEAVEGIASFASFDLSSGSYTLSASSGSLTTAAETSLAVRAAVTFLPAGSGVWHLASNWDANAIPNSPAASVIIPPNTATNRDVTNNAATTIGAVTIELGSSAFRNRITGTAGQPFTLASTNGSSSITVTGTGAGHANIEVPGGVVFSNQVVLDVQNTGSTNPEYGALRLQGTISGPGAIVKRGPGMAGITGSGKTFSGDITIEQGVLTFSEPAISGNNVTNYTVQPGGQLRLSSAGNPRNYLFKGSLNLAGSGRSGVAGDENLGVLGALRLETGTTGTVAVLTNNVHLTASADVHVPAGNAIRLDGPLTATTNTSVLTKSGGGTLTLSAGSATFTGGLAVNRGTLQLGGALLTNTTGTLVLTNETTLAGTGRWGGALDVRPGATITAALGASPGAAPLGAASVNVSGPATVAVTVAGNAVAGSYPLLVADGGIIGASNLMLSVTPSNFPYTALAVSNNTLHLVLAASQPGVTFHEWSGGAEPASDNDGNGFTALAEFALGAQAPGGAFDPPSFSVTSQGFTNYLTLTAVVRTNARGLAVTGQAASSLAVSNAWSTNDVEFIATTNNAPADHETRIYRTPATNNAGFLRLFFELAP